MLHPFLLLRDRLALERRLGLLLLEREDDVRFFLGERSLDSDCFRRLVRFLEGVRPESLRSRAGEAP